MNAQGAREVKLVTKQTRRDTIEGTRRMAKCAALYPEMEARLKSFPKAVLLDAAESMYKERGIPRPDRICFRRREPLICHYCKHFPDFPVGFCAIMNAQPIQQPIPNHIIPERIVNREPTREAPRDLIGAFHPKAADGGDIDLFARWDEDFFDSWCDTD
jgi:hypothetical protein